ncbi:MAG: DNA methylase [Candidatus Eisenbacteria bacterium]|nr:DNA methylase [Candidatus Eisenbacteria bacterium]
MNLIVAPRTDPIYNAHGYLTKVPEAAIRPFLERHTGPGDTVLDPFAGSGMTGVAAHILGRNAELSDISVLGQHIGRNLLNIVDPAGFRRAAARVVEQAEAKTGKYYLAACAACGQQSPFGKIVWSFVYACPACQAEVPYYDLLAANRWQSGGRCPACHVRFDKRRAQRIDERPVLMYVTCTACGNKEPRPLAPEDLRLGASAARSPLRKLTPNLPIEEDREMYRRSALGRHGNTSTASFFSPRNAVALTALHQAILAVEDEGLRGKLLFAFTAILPRASKRYQWHPKRPLNAQNQTYYIAPVFYEWNIFELFERKVSAALRAQEHLLEESGADTLFNRPSRVRYTTASADALMHLPDGSIDYVFTDPPFGSNLFYSDMSLFQEAWLGEVTDPRKEAVVQTERSKHVQSARAYEELLTGALRECARVLKPGGAVSIVFSNSRGEVWAMLQRAIRTSGFAIEPDETALLDKGQRSVKGLASGTEHVVTADLVITLRKDMKAIHPRAKRVSSARETIAEILSAAGAKDLRTPSTAYLHVIRAAVRRDIDLESLHLSEVLATLRSLGFSVNQRTGHLERK